MDTERDYNAITARHYAAYRPPLHSLILGRCLEKENKFSVGLDIGCGTGQSSIALSEFCEKVIGIEPSNEMLGAALAHPQVEYVFFDQEYINFPDNTFDVVTLAGSLFYAKSQNLLDEIIRVSQNSAQVIVYDFEILFQELYTRLGIEPQTDPLPYYHQEDFSGLDGEIKPLKTAVDQEVLHLQAANLAHLLLSVRTNYEVLGKKYKTNIPFTQLEDQLKSFLSDDMYPLEANIYYTIYIVDK